MFVRKKLNQVEKSCHSMEKHYGFISLFAFGVGACVGSGVFVLSGEVARTLAGASISFSWVIAGATCFVTALSYAELTSIVSGFGSTYLFAYLGLGEVFAVVAAFLLTLEYAVSGAAVARLVQHSLALTSLCLYRSWGDKLAYWFEALNIFGCNGEIKCLINDFDGLNFSAGIIVVASCMIQLYGLDPGRRMVNFLVILKLGLIAFIMIVCLLDADASNLWKNASEEGFSNVSFQQESKIEVVGGIKGVLRGATVTFFGFIGFDGVSSLSPEARNASHTVPLAILTTVIAITVIYVLVSLLLVSIVPWYSISEDEPFGSAFSQLGRPWAMHIVVAGEVIIVLPVVVLSSMIPQPRLLFAMAEDGILPEVFGKLDQNSNFRSGILFTGVFTFLLAVIVPFESLSEVVSGGILLTFIFTNCSVITIRKKAIFEDERRYYADNAVLCIFCGVSYLLFALLENPENKIPLVVVWLLYALNWALLLYQFSSFLTWNKVFEEQRFQVPYLPIFAGLAIQANLYLFLQLSLETTLYLLYYISFALVFYFVYGYWRSKLNSARRNRFDRIPNFDIETEQQLELRTI